MATFVVQRDLPGITPEALQSAALRSKSCCAEMTSEGEPVRWIRSFFQPETQQTNCYYEGADGQRDRRGKQTRRNSVHRHCGRGGDDPGDGIDSYVQRHAVLGSI